MNIRIEFEAKIDKLSRVFIFAQDAYLYTDYLHKPDTKEELDLVTTSAHAREISFIMHMMFRTLIVEISKLFSKSKNDKYQLNNFILSLGPSGHFREFQVSPEIIESWHSKIRRQEKVITDIIFLRDKIYAHTDDPNKIYSEIEIALNQIAILIDIAKEIICYLYSTVLSTHFVADSPTFDRERFNLLKLLAKAESDRIAEINKMYFGGRV